MSFIGYARVSTSEGKQLLDRQVDALTEIGCERIFEDKASGSNSQRKGLDDCLNYLRKGDVLVVLDLDRLGRLASELIKLIDELAEKDIGFKDINSPNDTTTPSGRAFLQIKEAIAEKESNIIRQREKEGI
uniref:recombinase family protein n=1 Tax=Escherichia coli TaxID=562 RepID=UPI00200F93F8